MKVKLLVILFLSGFLTHTWAACPRLFWWEFPSGTNTSAIVKRVNTNNTRNNTIFFCRANDVTSSVTSILFNETDLMDTQAPNTDGTDRVGLGTGTATVPIAVGSVNLSNNNQIGPYLLKQLPSKTIPTRNMPTAWNEQILFHFYRRYAGNRCQTNRRIRNYLRSNASIFRVGAQSAVSDNTFTYSIAKINDVVLTHKTDPTKTIKANLEFIWSQNALNNGGCGGSVAGYNHFGVAARLRVKTNALGTTYEIDQAGEYDVNVGVLTQN